MNICLFKNDEIEKKLPAGDERARHILKVLKKGAGDSFDAGIIGGKAGRATILSVTDGGIEFRFEEFSDARAEGKPLHPLSLIIGFPRPIQLRRLLRDCAGLGVRKIVLTGTELGEKSYLKSNDIKDGAAERMLLDGTVQAASTHVPELLVTRTLSEAVGHFSGTERRVALDNRRAKGSLREWLKENAAVEFKNTQTMGLSPLDEQHNRRQAASAVSMNSTTAPTEIVAAIGSERGWTDGERDFLESSGFSLCSMGSRVLRTETAAAAASAIILDATGHLG